MEALAMEAALENDDAFFADLSRQISLLIMDDDDDPMIASHCPSVSLQTFSRAIHPALAESSYIWYHHQQNWRRESSKGTGMFFPMQSSSHPRRKKRQLGSSLVSSSSSSSNKKLHFQQRHPHDSRKLPHASFHNSFNPK